MKTRQRLTFPFSRTWIQSFIPENFANIWQIERVEISAIKSEVARIHFLSDVFVAVAVVVAEAP